MRNVLFRGLAVAAVSLVAACGPFHTGSSSTAQLIFHNESTDQADVYATPVGGNPLRVGTVFAGRTDTLKVPESILGGGGNIRVSARLLTRSYAPSTGQFVLQSGDRVSIELPPQGNTLIVLPSK